MKFDNLKALFFDFDGVLADSVEVKTKAFAKLFEVHGPVVQAKVVEHHRQHGGMNRFDKFRHYYDAFLGQPLSEAELNELCAKFASLVVEEVVAAPEIAGAGEFLREASRQRQCFVVSATPENEIREIIKRRELNKYFTEILGAPVSKGDNLKNLLTKYSLSPADCLFFGDAESDFLAAQANNVPFIGVVPGVEAPLLKKRPKIQWFKNFIGTSTTDLKKVTK